MKLITEDDLLSFKYDMMMWDAPFENMVRMIISSSTYVVRYNANKNYERFEIV